MRKYVIAIVAAIVVALSTSFAVAQSYMLESSNFPGMFIRHFNFEAILTKVENAQDKKDAVFWGRTGLTGYNISFESYNFPGYYLRHKNFKLVLEKNDGSDLFKQDATFNGTKQGKRGYVFESVNFPGYYLRHKNFKLVLEENDNSAQFLADATFKMKSSGPVDDDPAPPPPDNPPAPPPGDNQATAARDVTAYKVKGVDDEKTNKYLNEGDAVTIIACGKDYWCQISGPFPGYWVWGPHLNR